LFAIALTSHFSANFSDILAAPVHLRFVANVAVIAGILSLLCCPSRIIPRHRPPSRIKGVLICRLQRVRITGNSTKYEVNYYA